jgi:alpha-ribazole phosphatase/probable phosphoglycerate mutase
LGVTDIALSDFGVWQAEQLRDRLAEEKITAIYTSTMNRARSTTEIIASRHKAKITSCKELNECDFGYIEGLTLEEVKQRYPQLAEELLGWKTVSFPGGESLEDLDKRLRSFLDRLGRHKEKEIVLIVAHGGTLRLIIGNLLGLKLEYWLRFHIQHASVSIVETFERGNVLTLLNDTSHLKT